MGSQGCRKDQRGARAIGLGRAEPAADEQRRQDPADTRQRCHQQRPPPGRPARSRTAARAPASRGRPAPAAPRRRRPRRSAARRQGHARLARSLRRVGASGDAAASGPSCASRTAVSPKRSSVSGSTSPPSSARSPSTSAQHLAQLGRRGSHSRAPGPARRPPPRTAPGAGRGGVPRSGGSGLPTRRAVAAGLRGARRVAPGPRLVEGQRERVDVAGGGHPPALGLLGRHVGQRAHHVAGGGQVLAAGQVGDAEVGELGEARRRRRARPAPSRSPGFTSRWITPRAWACSSASHSARPMRATSRSDTAPSRTSSSSVAPFTSSDTR